MRKFETLKQQIVSMRNHWDVYRQQPVRYFNASDVAVPPRQYDAENRLMECFIRDLDLLAAMAAGVTPLEDVRRFVRHDHGCKRLCVLEREPTTARCLHGLLGCRVDHLQGCTCGLDAAMSSLQA